MSRQFRQVMKGPFLVGMASVVGLVSALVGDGLWDALSWLALGLPLALAGWFGLRRRCAGREDAPQGPSPAAVQDHVQASGWLARGGE